MKHKIEINTYKTITGTYFTLTNWATKTEQDITTEEAITWWRNGLSARWTKRAKQYMEDILNPDTVQIW